MGGGVRRSALSRRGWAGALLFLCLFAPGAEASPPKDATRSFVSHVVDGDTFRAAGGERVRLAGINAPEYEPWKDRVDFYGKEAREYLRGLLTGKAVLLEYDVERRDKYGRTIAYVYLEDGRFVNQDLVESGYAKARTYFPNVRHDAALKAAERKAKAARKGVWSK